MIFLSNGGLQYAIISILLLALTVRYLYQYGNFQNVKKLQSFQFQISMTGLYMQPTTNERLRFKVPLVPLLPMLSIFFNVYLMMKLSEATW